MHLAYYIVGWLAVANMRRQMCFIKHICRVTLTASADHFKSYVIVVPGYLNVALVPAGMLHIV